MLDYCPKNKCQSVQSANLTISQKTFSWCVKEGLLCHFDHIEDYERYHVHLVASDASSCCFDEYIIHHVTGKLSVNNV